MAIDEGAVLICGPSGAGKSDLALRLIDEGALLVADDQTRLQKQDGQKQDVRLYATPPETIAGLLEVRGLGLVRLPYRSSSPVFLKIDLVEASQIERMPVARTCIVDGVVLPWMQLDPFSASATARVRLALRWARGDIILNHD